MSRRSQIGVVAALSLIVVTVGGLGYVIEGQYGATGVTILSVAVSAGLSAALVILYFRQSAILESQRDLLTAELNRGTREQHTETLRHRVRLWHGNPDRETGESPIDGPQLSLPTVGTCSFNSAPAGGDFIEFAGEEEEFHVIPRQLHGDRYLVDLLNNHARDLKLQMRYVHYLNTRFEEQRSSFIEEFDYGVDVEGDGFTLKPQEDLSRWIFDHLVKIERGIFDSFGEARKSMIGKISSTGNHPEEPIVWVRAKASHMAEVAIYGAHFREDELDNMSELGADARELAEESLPTVLNEVERDFPHDSVQAAAERLDEGVDAVDELEQILLEYDGKPVYRGDCEYLRDARIEAELDSE
ncbi:hypothetical protein [Halobaculum lipolyticum]|uniref:Uncharacterized protein n=1 Tax=Halobaculum lipolyticum TaxID=3032001 RepID=A0ABD5WC89_9EURY|nr:hypothetical protein [Halobaculum sp. DT31]